MIKLKVKTNNSPCPGIIIITEYFYNIIKGLPRIPFGGKVVHFKLNYVIKNNIIILIHFVTIILGSAAQQCCRKILQK